LTRTPTKSTDALSTHSAAVFADPRQRGVTAARLIKVYTMSMETHVFFRGRLPTKAALSRAMKELGFPFSIKPAAGSLEQQSGFMPMMRRGEETGVEFDVWNDHSAVAEFADVGVDSSYERVANFRWGGDYQEAVAGMCAAAALAKLMNGVVFDEAEDRLLSIDDATSVARRSLQTLVKRDEPTRLGTRPADLKQYLKPLLKQRSDLVLIGRMLIIRPVRHLLRGVFFDRTSDKYQFRVSRYITPLFPVEEGAGYKEDIHPVTWEVWQPHFNDFLFDSLAEDIFDHVGQILTLGDFAHDLDTTYVVAQAAFQHTRVAALALAGLREEAAQLVDELERSNPDNSYWHHFAKTQRAFLERKTEDLCAEFHLKEAEAAKQLKLGGVWEPTPFPAELPKRERSRCAEPHFVTTPWIPRPPGLVGQVPDHPGEIRFAKDVLRRKGGLIMLVPLTREAAEEMHRTRQDYVLATRLPGQVLLVLYHHTWWSPHDPEQPRNPDYVPTRKFRLEVHGALGRLHTEFTEGFDKPGVLKMWSVSVKKWSAYNKCDQREKTIYDHRSDPRGYEVRPMSDSDLLLCEFAEPAFGEFNDLWLRICSYLENEGFGSFA
jgi:hypothetical protein